MSDTRLRIRERDYAVEPTQENLLHLLDERIRAGLELEPDRIRALVAKPPVRCFLYTVETTGPNGAAFVLEIPAVKMNPRPFPELGGEWIFHLPLWSEEAKPFLGFHLGFVTFDEASTGARLSTKPEIGIMSAPHLLLVSVCELKFTWNFNPKPPPTHNTNALEQALFHQHQRLTEDQKQ